MTTPIFDRTEVLNAPIKMVNPANLPVQQATFDLAKFDQMLDANNGTSTAVAGISQKMLSTVRASDADVFGEKLNQLVIVSKGIDPTKFKKGGLMNAIAGMFSSTKQRMLAQYNSVEKQIDQLVEELDKNAALHRGRVKDFEQMFVQNWQYHESLEADIAQKIEYKTQLEQQLASFEASTDTFDVQNARDVKTAIDRLDKRVNDLERAKLMSKQMAPQIRQMQDNARSLVSSFGDVKAVTIPAWKNVFTLYLSQLEQKKSAELTNAVYDATDDALRQQADAFRENTAAIAKVAQRSVVDIATLEHAHNQLLGAFDDLEKISDEGRKARKESEQKIRALEQQLVQKFTPKAITQQ